MLTLDSGKLGCLVTELGGFKVEADGQAGLCCVAAQVKSRSVDIDYCWKPGHNVDLATLKWFMITGCQDEPHVKLNAKPVKPIFSIGAHAVGI